MATNKQHQLDELTCKKIQELLRPAIPENSDAEIRISPRGIKVIKVTKEVVGEASN